MSKRYQKSGFLAIHPRAFFEMFAEKAPERVNTLLDKCTVVEIQGPLEHHNSGGPFDSYDSIHDRVVQACAGQAPIVVLKIDSPGGDVSGCFDTAREIRECCTSMGKMLVAYIDGSACSAAYALASAAHEIVIPPTGIVGSIGVINARVDTSSMDRAMGVQFSFTVSGARKLDGNPHIPMTDAEAEATKRSVDGLANSFFELVADFRIGKTDVNKLAALEAGVLVGRAAIEAGLADKVESFDQMLARFATTKEGSMSALADARAALAKIAEGDGEEAAAARKALKAMDGEEEKEKEEKKPAPEAVSAASEAPEKKDDPEARAQSALATAGALGATVHQLSARMAKIESEREEAARSAFLASRPDLAKELVEVLATKPLAEVKAIVNAIPKPVLPHANHAASSTPNVTRGEGQGEVQTPDSGISSMDVQMGLVKYEMKARREGNSLIFGAVPVPMKGGAK